MQRKTMVGVLGIGLFGASLARTLTENGADVLALDNDMDHLEEIADEVEAAIQADFTKLDQLEDAGVADLDIVVIASSSHLENVILAIINCRKLGVETIVVKTKNEEYREVLMKVGADRVVLPEVEMGVRFARELVNPTFHKLMSLDDHYNIIEFPARKEWVNHSITDLDFRKEFGINIIALKPEKAEHYDIEFSPEYVIKPNDLFIGISAE